MSYNAWLYGYANPVKYVDHNGLKPDEGCSILDNGCVDLTPNERDLTSWLYRELITNASSSYAIKIHSFIRGNNLVNVKKGYQAFYNLVQDRAKWDFKHKIRAEFETEAFVLFHGLKRSEYRWYEYSVAGNISFGYVGRASGIPGDILHLGAGWAEVKDPGHKEETWCNLDCSSFLCGSYYVNPDWIKTIFDDPQDAAAVDVGIKMYDQYGGRFMTYDNFQSALKAYGYLLAQSLEYHDWRWKNNKGNWPYEVGHFNGPNESKFEPIIQELLFKR